MVANMQTAMPAPWNELYLWWLGRPEAPMRIGVLRFVPSMRGVSLQYDAHWLAQGFALSEDLPLLDQVFLPVHKDAAAGAVDDARPDRSPVCKTLASCMSWCSMCWRANRFVTSSSA